MPLILALSVAVTAEPVPPRAVVVCPLELRPGLENWIHTREGQGWHLSMVEPADSAPGTRDAIRQADPQARFVVLIGDTHVPLAGPINPQRQTPAWYAPTPISARFGSTDTAATDLPYGDLDGDGVPEAAVGRLPADQPDALNRLTDRILAAESNRDFGIWRRQVHLVAGVGGFGPIADTAIETAAGGLIQTLLPVSMQPSITYASPSSPFFPGYDQFRECAKQRYSQGGLAWVYVGHGQITELDRVPSGDGVPILTADEVDQLTKPAQAPPLALFLACYTGAFDARADCVAERMVLSDRGPVAAIAGSRVTMPYGNAVFAASLMDAWFHQRVSHLGELVNHARQHLLDPQDNTRPKILDFMAGAFSPTADQLPQERVEHASLYNLLGDPTMLLAHPKELSLTMESRTAPGETIDATIEVNEPGELLVELCVPLSRVRKPAVQDSNDPRSREGEAFNLQQDLTVVDSHSMRVPTGPYKVQLLVPEAFEGEYVVRGFLKCETHCALGANRIRAIQRPKSGTQ